MEPHEALEHHEKVQETAEKFKRPAAVLIAVLAAILAIATVSGNNASTKAILAQAEASDTWNQYQANSFKRHINENDAAILRLLSSGAQRAQALNLAATLKHAVATKYSPEQNRLQPLARELETTRDKAESRHRTFEFAEASLQLAIVLCSISVVVDVMALLYFGGLVGAIGALLTGAGLAALSLF